MTTPPLFDDSLKAMRRARASRLGFEAFLHLEAADILQERLQEVNRPFQRQLIVTGAKAPWRAAFPAARIRADGPVITAEPGFDLAIHAMCLHAHNDPVGQLVQLRHLLKPDGLMIAVLLGGQTLAELRASLAEAEIAMRGGLSPRVAPMGEIRDLGGLIGRAGFALPVADSITLNTTYETPLHLMRELRAMGETNVLSAQDRGMMRRDMIGRMIEIYSENFSQSDRIRATFELVFLTGWAPSENQQKPLRPGSANTRLADVLKTSEISAGEKPDTD